MLYIKSVLFPFQRRMSEDMDIDMKMSTPSDRASPLMPGLPSSGQQGGQLAQAIQYIMANSASITAVVHSASGVRPPGPAPADQPQLPPSPSTFNPGPGFRPPLPASQGIDVSRPPPGIPGPRPDGPNTPTTPVMDKTNLTDVLGDWINMARKAEDQDSRPRPPGGRSTRSRWNNPDEPRVDSPSLGNQPPAPGRQDNPFSMDLGNQGGPRHGNAPGPGNEFGNQGMPPPSSTGPGGMGGMGHGPQGNFPGPPNRGGEEGRSRDPRVQVFEGLGSGKGDKDERLIRLSMMSATALRDGEGPNNGPGRNRGGPGGNVGGPGGNMGGPGGKIGGPGGNSGGPGGKMGGPPGNMGGPGGNMGGPGGNMGGPGANMGGPGGNMGGPGGNMGPGANMGGPGGNMGGPGGNMGGPGNNMGGPGGTPGGNMGGPGGNMGGPGGNMSGPRGNIGGPVGNLGGPGPARGGPGPNMGGPGGPGNNLGGPVPNMEGPGGNMGGPGRNMGGPGPGMGGPNSGRDMEDMGRGMNPGGPRPNMNGGPGGPRDMDDMRPPGGMMPPRGMGPEGMRPQGGMGPMGPPGGIGSPRGGMAGPNRMPNRPPNMGRGEPGMMEEIGEMIRGPGGPPGMRGPMMGPGMRGGMRGPQDLGGPGMRQPGPPRGMIRFPGPGGLRGPSIESLLEMGPRGGMSPSQARPDLPPRNPGLLIRGGNMPIRLGNIFGQRAPLRSAPPQFSQEDQTEKKRELPRFSDDDEPSKDDSHSKKDKYHWKAPERANKEADRKEDKKEQEEKASHSAVAETEPSQPTAAPELTESDVPKTNGNSRHDEVTDVPHEPSELIKTDSVQLKLSVGDGDAGSAEENPNETLVSETETASSAPVEIESSES